MKFIDKIIIALFVGASFFFNLPSANAEIINLEGTASYNKVENESNKKAQQRAVKLAHIQAVELASVYVESIANTNDSVLSDDLIKATARSLIKYKAAPEIQTVNEKEGHTNITVSYSVYFDTDEIRPAIEKMQAYPDFNAGYKEILNSYKQLQNDVLLLQEQLKNTTDLNEQQAVTQQIKENDNQFVDIAKLEKKLSKQISATKNS